MTRLLHPPLRSPRLRASAVVTALLLLAASVAARSGSARADAEATISRLATVGSVEQRLVKRPLEAARHELVLATSAQRAGDEKAAALREELARDHARHAEAVLEASRLEKRADEQQRAATALEERLVRARTAFDETLARKGRAEKRLEQAEAERQRLAAPPAPTVKPAGKAPGAAAGKAPAAPTGKAPGAAAGKAPKAVAPKSGATK